MDANGCVITGMYQVIEPLALQTSIQLSGTILQSSTSGGTGNCTYEWSFGGSVVSTAMTVAPDPTQSGYYTLVVTDQNGCTVTASYQYTATSNFIEELGMQMNVYPNPATSFLMIELSGNDKSTAYPVRLLDARGRLVWNDHLIEQLRVERASIATGIYFLEVEVEDRVVRHKLAFTE
jgi:hypothetical protein